MKNLARILPLILVGLPCAACGPADAPPAPAMAPTSTAPMDDTATPKPVKVAAPSALALSCKTDVECQGHKCNTQVGRCSYPCASDDDCTNGGSCQANGAPGMAICVAAPRRR